MPQTMIMSSPAQMSGQNLIVCMCNAEFIFRCELVSAHCHAMDKMRGPLMKLAAWQADMR